jgi:two-component system sensor histidine kinase PilS (NtrC family)
LNTDLTGTSKIAFESANIWRPLVIFNLFRFLIASLFIILYASNTLFLPFASYKPELFLVTSIAYAFISIVIGILNYEKKPRFDIQAYLNVYTDIIVITTLMYASGGVASGLGMLMVIAIGGGSIVMGGRHALLFASLSSIAVLLEELYRHIETPVLPGNYIHAGILGITFFVTAVLTHTFAKRIRETEALARKRGIDLANMADLTEHIIQRMQTGILVVDADNYLRLINESAWYMLGQPDAPQGKKLERINKALSEQLESWRAEPDFTSKAIKPISEHAEVMPRFAQISSEDDNTGSLIYLEDTSELSREAQQLQLASLGRLTASIAHEIRNPLGAISHAGQLLEESPNMDTHDKRLTEIIRNHSKRVNTIIESILQLGRRDSSHTEIIVLKDYLERFRRDLLAGKTEKPEEYLTIHLEPDDLSVRFDITHLQQILTNLCENALRYSEGYPGYPKVEIRGGINAELNRPYLDIIDNGPGIPEEDQQHIFEPFFTTSSSGTGLGLYLSRELAACNQAHINYIAMKPGGSCFRITFQDPRRQMN